MGGFSDAYDDAEGKRRGTSPTPAPRSQGGFGTAYDKAQAKRQTKAKTTPTPGRTTPGGVVGNKPTIQPLDISGAETNGPPLDAVSWVIDMLNRGAYASKQVASNVVDETINTIKDIKEPGGSDAVDVLNGFFMALGRSTVTDDSYFRAFAGNDMDRKGLGSDLIEESTDKFGAAFDPNYVNRVDNVPTYAKGPAGLGFDIFGDATTYIPPLLIAKAIATPFKIAYHGGKAIPVLGKNPTVAAVPGAKALGYKGFATGMRAQDDLNRTVREAAELRAAGGSTPPGGRGGGPTQHPATGNVPGGPTPRPTMGATGVAQRATPTTPLNPLGQTVQTIARITGTGMGVVGAAGRALGRIYLRDAEEAPGVVEAATQAAPAVPNTFHEMSTAEAQVHRAEAQIHQEVVEAAQTPRTPGRRATRPGDATAPAPARTAPTVQEHMAARGDKSYDEVLRDEQAAAGGGSIPIPGSVPRAVENPVEETVLPASLAPVIVRDPLPEGASADLDVVLNAGRNATSVGWKANTLVKHAQSPLPSKDVASLLKREAGEGKPLNVNEATVLDNLRYDAAVNLRQAQEAVLHTTAAKAASRVPKNVVEEAKLHTTTDLFNILKKSPFVPGVKKFIDTVKAQVGKEMDGLKKQAESAPRVQQGPTKGALIGTLKYRDTEYLGTGIFNPAFDDLRENAMHHWLSEGGQFGKTWEDGDVLVLRDDTELAITAEEIRATVDRLSRGENNIALRDAATGRDFMGPETLSERDGMVIEAIWARFYDDLKTGQIHDTGPIESIVIADAVQALEWYVEHRWTRVKEILGAQTAAIVKQTLGSNPAAAVNHFEALGRVADDTFTVEQLEEILNLRRYEVKGGQSILHTFFADIGKFPEYKSWLDAKKGEAGVVRPPAENPAPINAGQVPTPAEAIPKDVIPSTAVEVVAAPSSVTPHPVGLQGVMDEVQAIRGPAATAGEEGWRVGIANALLTIFDRTILKPQGLSHNPSKGLYMESALATAKAYRTDLWNAPKQVEFAQMVDKILTEHFDDIRAKTGGIEGPWGKYENAKKDPKGTSGGMPWEVAEKYEDQYLLEALKVVDGFLSKMGVRQVLGTDVKGALPLSLGDIVGVIHHHTTATEKFTPKWGAQANAIRRMILTGGARPGSAKVNWTNLTEAVRVKLWGGDRDAVVGALLNDRKQGIRGEVIGPMPQRANEVGIFDPGQNPNNWNNPRYATSATKHFRQIGEAKQAEWKAVFPNATFRKNPKGGVFMDVPGEDLANATADLIDDMTRDLGNIATNNGWRGKNATVEGKDIILEDLVGANFKAMAADPTRTPELIRHLANLDETADAVGEAKFLTDDAAKAAVEEAEAVISPKIVQGAKHESDIANAQTPGAGAKVNQAETAAAIGKAQRDVAHTAQTEAHQKTEEHLSELLNDPEVVRALNEDVVEPLPAPTPHQPMEETNPWMQGAPEHRPMTDAESDAVWGSHGELGAGLPTAGGGRSGGGRGRGRHGTTPPAGGGGRGSNIGTPSHVAAADEVTQVFDLNAPYETAYLNTLGMFMFNTGKFFNAALGMAGLVKGVQAASVLSSTYLAKVNDDLTALSRTFGKDTLDKAFEVIQKGVTHNDPQVQLAVTELQKKLSLLWDTQGDAVLGNAFLGSDPMITHLNDMLGKYFPENGAPNARPQFDLNAAQTLMQANAHMTLGEALAVQWRDWPVADAPDFIARLMSAAVNVAEHRAVINLFEENVAKWGGTSATHMEGWAQPRFIAKNNKDKSAFIHFINQDLYYPIELLNELRHADIFTTTSRQVQGEAASWVTRYYGPTLNAWKRAMTINRPGHHIRNFIGDMVMTYTVRGMGNSGPSIMDAAKIHASAGAYTDMDFMVLLRDLHKQGLDPRRPHAVDEVVQIPKFDEELFTGHMPDGTDRALTIGEVSDYLHGNGLRPTYIAGEGLFDNAEMAGKVSKWASYASLERTAYGRLMGTASQARDHYQRTQHFMQILRQEMSANRKGAKFAGQWNTLDELASLAAKEVRRYHPDASMLTPKEAKYMRLIFPFYSWQAKILPAFFESFIRYPGRISNLSKANYETAVTFGVNPDSVYDPFPNDQNFPDYMQNRVMGPQFQMPVTGEYVGFDPGIPQFDMLNDFLGVEGGPVTNVLGSVTPIARAPFEWATGQQVGNVPILDKSEFIDSQIPGASYWNNITGTSLTGTLSGAGLWGDTDEIDPNHENPFDIRRQVRTGNYQGTFNEFGAPSSDAVRTLFNWLSGLGVTGMSHENQRAGAD